MQVLSDPNKRATYDRFGKSGLNGQSGNTVDPNELFRTMFEGMQEMMAQMMGGMGGEMGGGMGGGMGAGNNGIPHPAFAGFGGGAGMGPGMTVDLTGLFAQLGAMHGAAQGAGGGRSAPHMPPRSARDHGELCAVLRAKYGEVTGLHLCELHAVYFLTGFLRPLPYAICCKVCSVWCVLV